MKATIEIPDDLYARIRAKSERQGRPIPAVAVELFQRWLDEESVISKEADAVGRSDAVESMLRLAQELAKHASLGPTATEILEQDRGRLEDWLQLGEEASRNAPPGPTATEILDADRNRLEHS